MGKHRPLPSQRKMSSKRKRGMELLFAAARPPKECWSIRERCNFKIALVRFGQDWPRVAQFIGTKTTEQICVYAHEYLMTRCFTQNRVKKLSAEA